MRLFAIENGIWKILVGQQNDSREPQRKGSGQDDEKGISGSI
jgi:hypothetical protein